MDKDFIPVDSAVVSGVEELLLIGTTEYLHLTERHYGVDYVVYEKETGEWLHEGAISWEEIFESPIVNVSSAAICCAVNEIGYDYMTPIKAIPLELLSQFETSKQEQLNYYQRTAARCV